MHRINLKGPWQFAVVDGEANLLAGNSKQQRVKLPHQVSEADLAGKETTENSRLVYSRRFGCPTGLEPNDRVDLCVGMSPASFRCYLNDQKLPHSRLDDEASLDSEAASQVCRFAISALLQVNNHLQLSLAFSSDLASSNRCGLSSEVWIEIHAEE